MSLAICRFLTFYQIINITKSGHTRSGRQRYKCGTCNGIFTETRGTIFYRRRTDAPPPTVSDGWGGIREAMVEVYGKVPGYSGTGRPPSRKRPQPGWKYLQIVKQRDGKGNLCGTRFEAVYGDPDELVELLGKSTAYVERTHLTMRIFSSRLTRKTIAFSKEIEMHKGCAVIEDMYYNLIRPHKTLRQKNRNGGVQKWTRRSPAMAAKLTDHIWTLKELLTTVVIGRQHSTGLLSSRSSQKYKVYIDIVPHCDIKLRRQQERS